jgi:hypothetical protein
MKIKRKGKEYCPDTHNGNGQYQDGATLSGCLGCPLSSDKSANCADALSEKNIKIPTYLFIL